MSKPTVRCRCGHQVLAKEVLRTDLYERASGRDYVYIKFRCRRCKRMGEAFVAEDRWDWDIFEPAHNELTEGERDAFGGRAAISAEDVESLSKLLNSSGQDDFIGLCRANLAPTAQSLTAEAPAAEPSAGSAQAAPPPPPTGELPADADSLPAVARRPEAALPEAEATGAEATGAEATGADDSAP